MSVLAADSMPVPASAGFGVSFVDVGESRRHEPLSLCWIVPFERVLPARAFGLHKGQKSFSGMWWSATTGDHVGYESWLERDHVVDMDFDPAVTGLSSQPFRLWWDQDGKSRSHTPDYFARLRDGTGVVLDVRADDRIEPKDAEAFAATARACASVGWEFRRSGDTGGAERTVNLRWLAGYRHPRCLDDCRAAGLRRAFREPRPLLDGARQVGDPIAVLPVLYHLLWAHVLEADLDTVLLSPSSAVWCRG
jgi:hypothetical protein